VSYHLPGKTVRSLDWKQTFVEKSAAVLAAAAFCHGKYGWLVDRYFSGFLDPLGLGADLQVGSEPRFAVCFLYDAVWQEYLENLQ